MDTTLGEAKAEARRFFREADYARALRAYDQVLAAVPSDYDVRLRIADVLARVGLEAEAADVYRAVGQHDVRSGHGLPALVARDGLLRLGQPARDIDELFVATYAAGSPRLGRFAVRQAPIEPSTRLPALELGTPEAFDLVAARAHARALDVSAVQGYPQQVHPLPLLSELEPGALADLIGTITVRPFAEGEAILRQGDPGSGVYLVASGEVRVSAQPDREIARLFEGTLFGEMSLISDEPRSASVHAVGPADIVEISRDVLRQLGHAHATVNAALDRFARERLIRNLLASSPLFTPFTKAQQAELLRRFEGLDVEAGTDLINEGDPGRGLFVVVAGACAVSKAAEDGTRAEIARLRPGDIFGEMSLLANEPASATVTSVTKGTLLFLARTYVERLAAAIPEVRAYFQAVAQRRSRENQQLFAHLGAPNAPMELDESDVLLL